MLEASILMPDPCGARDVCCNGHSYQHHARAPVANMRVRRQWVPHPPSVVPILIDGTLYLTVIDVAPNHQMTFSLQTSDQKLLWRLPLGVPGGAIVAAEDGVIYLESGSLLAIRLSDGTVLWHAPLPDGLAVSGAGHLFFSQTIGYVGHLLMSV